MSYLIEEPLRCPNVMNCKVPRRDLRFVRCGTGRGRRKETARREHGCGHANVAHTRCCCVVAADKTEYHCLCSVQRF
jgi:hypothetical protein